jgi:hypothetical protein
VTSSREHRFTTDNIQAALQPARPNAHASAAGGLPPSRRSRRPKTARLLQAFVRPTRERNDVLRRSNAAR